MLMFRPLLRYADFKGRANRLEYLLFAVVQGVWYTLLIGLMAAAMSSGASDTGEPGTASPGVLIAFSLILLSIAALVVPNYAVLVRRLHDSGRGAIWLCLMLPSVLSSLMTLGTIVTAIGAVGAGADRETFAVTALAGLGAAGLLGLIGMLCQMVMFVLVLLPGTRGPNRFGPDPRDPSAFSGDPSFGGLAGYDDDRLEALFAQARKEQGIGEPPVHAASAHRPIFDFTPGSTGPMMRSVETRPAAMAAPPPAAPMRGLGQGWNDAGSPAPTFGRRRS